MSARQAFKILHIYYGCNRLPHPNSLPLIQKTNFKPPTHPLATDLRWNIATNWKLLLHYKMTLYLKLICNFFPFVIVYFNFLRVKTMALKVTNKINGKLKFLYRFLSPELRRILCNALIQPHFDYVHPAWYPNLTEKTKKEIQIMQNKCINFP